MGVTYEQARQSIRDVLAPEWRWGTFCLDDRTIVENDEVFVFNVGARELLVDRDLAYAIASGVSVVYKDDGRLGALPSTMVATDPTVRIRPNPSPTMHD
ncbi:MAG: hypothetical protein JWN03_7499 [Nocardia sp.]|uniref:hypothetical protein n=1 Tax=Nocardia sp. TaxID=1821 RepID=UPI0026148976|nr:hypothetical protein [Nocardia sp.]MCU1647224.1 hypothetical protein [Nocardia sp.]